MVINKISIILYIILLSQGIFNHSFCQNSSDSINYKRLTKFVLASVNYTHYSATEYAKGNEVGKVSMNEYRTKIQFVLKLKEKKTYLLNTIDITQFDVYAVKGAFQDFNKNYYSFSYSIGLIQILKNRWKIVGVFSPTLASDFNDNISGDDFTFQSSVLAIKRASGNYEYGFGIAHSYRFGRALTIPLLSYTYRKDRWSHKGVIPVYVASYYKIRNLGIGMKMATFGNVYNSTNTIVSNLELDKLGYSRINIGPELIFRIYKSLYININSGITVRNRLYSINSYGEFEMELNAGKKIFFNLGLSILK